MTIEDILGQVFNISVWSVAKGLFLFALFIYLLFALIVIKQVQLMTQVVEVRLGWLIRIISLIHFLLALGAFWLAWKIL